MAGLSAGRLVDLADHAHLLQVELEQAGFDTEAVAVGFLVAHIEREAGARAVQELRATSNGTDAGGLWSWGQVSDNVQWFDDHGQPAPNPTWKAAA
jgi:hypothetical protein